MEKYLAIIPARSGSKGIKDKNIRKLNNKPLMAYTIEAAVKSNLFADIIVSTDSQEYAEIACEYGAEVPFLRSKELSKDDSSSIDMIMEVISNLKYLGKEYENLMLLQPTSPFRDEHDILNAVDLFVKKKANSIVSMCECDHSPLLSIKLDDDRNLEGFLSNVDKYRRQDLNKYYTINGAIYLVKVDYFLKCKSFYKERSYAYIMEKEKSLDIDYEEDFYYAEYKMCYKEKK